MNGRRYAFAFLRSALFGLVFCIPQAAGQSLGEADEEFVGGRYIRYARHRLTEGELRISVMASAPDGSVLDLQVRIKHLRPVPADPGMLEKLGFATTGVQAQVRVTGRGIPKPEVQSDQASFTDERTGLSRVEIPWSTELVGEAVVEEDGVAVTGEKADPWTGSVTLWVSITEPQGTAHPPLMIPLPLRNVRRATCEEGLRSHPQAEAIGRQLQALQSLILEQQQKIRKAHALKDDLDESLRIAESYLDNATYFLNASDKAAQEFEKAFEKAETAEDILGLLQLGMSLGKAGWKILKNPKFQQKMNRALAGSPKDLMHFKRALSTRGGDLPRELLEKAAAVDDKRIEAVAEAMKEMQLLPDKDIKFIGSAQERMNQFLGRGGPPKKWNGLESDIDVEFVGRNAERAEDFKRLVADKMNQKLLDLKMKGIDDVGDLSINTFAGNLSQFNILEREGMTAWVHGVKRPAYLASKDAYRTYGGQRLAAYYGAAKDVKDSVRLDAVDGYEITREMAARAETIWKTKNRLDKKVFKDVRKHYERALLGMELRNGSTKPISEIMVRINNNPLIREADRVVAAGTADRKLADRMMEAVRGLDRTLGETPPMPQNRRAVFDYGKKILDIEKTGAPGLLYSPLQRYQVRRALDEANRLWAEELQLPSWTDYSLAQEVAAEAGLGLGGLLKWAGNPITSGLKEAAWYWMEPGEADLKDSRREIDSAMNALLGAEKRWKILVETVEQLQLDQDLRNEWDRRIQEGVEGIPAEARDCFELILNAQMQQMQEDFQDLVTAVDRMKQLRERFTRNEMLAELDNRPELNRLIGECNGQLERLEREQDKNRKIYGEYQAARSYGFRNFDRKTLEVVADYERIQAALDETAGKRAAAKAGLSAYARLEKILPAGLRFDDLAIALQNRKVENELGTLSGRALMGYAVTIKNLLHGLRAGQLRVAMSPEALEGA
ncbi:MAG: hypothetical protein HYU36_11365 [Planctomycetes bacterium]|nr:hypothetical protein [Planctomycetota bacterium]